MSKASEKKQSDEFVDAVTKALKRPAKEARRIAKMHGTKVWIIGRQIGGHQTPDEPAQGTVNRNVCPFPMRSR